MALSRFISSLHRTLCAPSSRVLAAQLRHIGTSTPRFDEEKGADEGQEQDDEGAGPDSSSSLVDAEEGQSAPKPPPYAEELRKILQEKYLSNQPVARPHSLCGTREDLSLEQLRLQYKKNVSAVRKKYIQELEMKRAAKATQDKKLREEIRLAKEERLRLRKERSAQRAIEVAEEKRILQEQLAKERSERRAHRKMMDMKIEERRQRERDLIRQESGKWIEERDLEMRIVQAYLSHVKL